MIGAAFFGAAFLIPYKAAGADAPAETATLAMFIAAAVLNTVAALARGARALRVDRISVSTAVVLAALSLTGNVALSRALALVGAGIASTVLRTEVLFVAMAAWLLLRERVTVRFAIGAVIVIGGFALMRLPASGASVSPAGLLWCVGASLSFASLNLVTRKVARRIQPVAVNAMRLWLAAGILLCIPGNADALTELGPRPWLLCAAAAFVGPFVSRICIMHALRHIPVSHATLLNLVGPLFAFLLDFAAFGALPSALELTGGAIILAGVSLPVLELAAAARARDSPPALTPD